MTSPLALEFARKIRAREQVVGYWVVLDAPAATERIARLGYDYVALDAQHGLLDYSGIVHGLMAIDARAAAVGMVRVEANNLTAIGKALDAGAVGVIVPLINTVEDAATAVAAPKYPPVGGAFPGDPAVEAVFNEALARIAAAAKAAGIAAGIHTLSGEVAAQRLTQGYTFTSMASDLAHLEQAAKERLEKARGDGGV
ncbi:aldolase/citrate lyase family protein [Pseudarthrobacter sp. J1738]|uniref:aldolase/citrate lyase family protein n=1 Tax=Pseudarthrobacter sp. J1738 TaxID=3420446 RepID=UPI003D2A6C89